MRKLVVLGEGLTEKCRRPWHLILFVRLWQNPGTSQARRHRFYLSASGFTENNGTTESNSLSFSGIHHRKRSAWIAQRTVLLSSFFYLSGHHTEASKASGHFREAIVNAYYWPVPVVACSLGSVIQATATRREQPLSVSDV